MSASNSSGIQTLLQAEQKAQETVQEARSYRAQRLKASKSDAVADIEKYKSKKESEFSASTSESQDGDVKAEEVAAKEAKTEVEKIKKETAKKRSDVVKFLIDTTLDTSATPA